MPYWAARLILASLALAGILFTVSVHYRGLPIERTTSYCLRAACEKCPQITVLLMLLAYNLLADAFPDTNRWVLLGCVVIPFYCLGHALWPIP